MNDYTRKLAEEDNRLQRGRDVQNEHWKVQQDYNTARAAAEKAAGDKR